MKEIVLPIKTIDKKFKIFIFLGVLTMTTGICFAFVLDSNSNYRNLLIATPLVVGFLVTQILLVSARLSEIGSLKLTEQYIYRDLKKSIQRIGWTDISNLNLVIEGVSGDTRRSYIPGLNRDLLPIELGHRNYLHIRNKIGKKFNYQFYIENKSQEKQLLDFVKTVSENFNLPLKIKN